MKKHFTSMLLAIAMCLSLCVPTFAATVGEENDTEYIYNDSGIRAKITYRIENDIIYETTIITESGTVIAQSAVVIKEVYANDTVVTRIDGAVKSKHVDGIYSEYLNIATKRGAILSPNSVFAVHDICNNHLQARGSSVSYGKDVRGMHSYVSTERSTIDISKHNTSVAVVAALIGSQLSPAAGLAIGLFVTLAQYANSTSASYIDLTEYKYFVPDTGAGTAMSCYHLYTEYYDYAPNGTRQVYESGWSYYQYIV